jgi:hypothetical protein
VPGGGREPARVDLGEHAEHPALLCAAELGDLVVGHPVRRRVRPRGVERRTLVQPHPRRRPAALPALAPALPGRPAVGRPAGDVGGAQPRVVLGAGRDGPQPGDAVDVRCREELPQCALLRACAGEPPAHQRSVLELDRVGAGRGSGVPVGGSSGRASRSSGRRRLPVIAPSCRSEHRYRNSRLPHILPG